MPIPTPHKGEKQDDFMERCMHEASSNPDRTNEQNVAICMDAWRNKDKKKTDSENMNTFKTLAEARGAYETLAAQLADMQQKTAKMADLEEQLAESRRFQADLGTENENFKAQIEQKDAEIAVLKSEEQTLSDRISEFMTQVETLEKSQKTAKMQARELVAASGGAPIAVDQAEIARMQAGDEKEFISRMAKEMDPAKLSQLYREYNKLFRPNGKNKKN